MLIHAFHWKSKRKTIPWEMLQAHSKFSHWVEILLVHGHKTFPLLRFHSLEQHNDDQAYCHQKRTSKSFQKYLTLHAKLAIPCEQRLHFRGMSWRAKSSLCRSTCYRACAKFVTRFASNWFVKSAWVSRESNLRKLPANYSPRAFVLFFCFAPSGFKYFSRKISTDRLF